MRLLILLFLTACSFSVFEPARAADLIVGKCYDLDKNGMIVLVYKKYSATTYDVALLTGENKGRTATITGNFTVTNLTEVACEPFVKEEGRGK